MSQRYETADCMNYELLKQFAYKNRGNPTAAESMLWQYLKDKQFGFRFRRQHVIGNYIADFVCIKKKLIIEIDGEYHSVGEQPKLDKQTNRMVTTTRLHCYKIYKQGSIQ